MIDRIKEWWRRKLLQWCGPYIYDITVAKDQVVALRHGVIRQGAGRGWRITDVFQGC